MNNLLGFVYRRKTKEHDKGLQPLVCCKYPATLLFRLKKISMTIEWERSALVLKISQTAYQEGKDKGKRNHFQCFVFFEIFP